jgi:hypothetical protein
VSRGLLPARFVVRSLIAGALAAALAAILALLQGNFDGTHWRVVATSLSFSVASATAGAGESLRARGREGWRAFVGIGTVIASAAAFVLLLVALWFHGREAVWRGCGVFALLALCGSHAALVLRARRPSDTPLIDALVATSIATATFDTLVGTVAVTGAVERVSAGFVRLVAVVLVVMLLTTALVPLLRRVGAAPSSRRSGAPERAATSRGAHLTLERLADEVAAVADRLDSYAAPPAVGREAQALRDLVARATTRD